MYVCMVPKLHEVQLLLFAHKVVHHPEQLPQVFCRYFQFNNTFRHHQTISVNDTRIRRAHTGCG